MRFNDVMKAGGNAFEAARALAEDIENTDKDGHFHRLVATPEEAAAREAADIAVAAVIAVQAVQGLQAPKDSPR